jgi:hypothetical protein
MEKKFSFKPVARVLSNILIMACYVRWTELIQMQKVTNIGTQTIKKEISSYLCNVEFSEYNENLMRNTAKTLIK